MPGTTDTFFSPPQQPQSRRELLLTKGLSYDTQESRAFRSRSCRDFVRLRHCRLEPDASVCPRAAGPNSEHPRKRFSPDLDGAAWPTGDPGYPRCPAKTFGTSAARVARAANPALLYSQNHATNRAAHAHPHATQQQASGIFGKKNPPERMKAFEATAISSRHS